MKTVGDVKIMPGKEYFSQHRLRVIDLVWKNKPISKKTWESKVVEAKREQNKKQEMTK